MKRELTGHKVNGCNGALRVTACDEISAGGACVEYRIEPTIGNAAGVQLRFQNGEIKDGSPPNGVTHEALLAILIDRLEGFQSGKFACDDNLEALEALRTAQTALQRRTVARVARGVEGTHEQ